MKIKKEIEEYFHPYFYPVIVLIRALYDMEGCSCGGLCHIVTDDDNIYDDCLNTVIEMCTSEQYSDHVDTEVCLAICRMLKKMNFYQRSTLFFMLNSDTEIHDTFDCGPDSTFRYIYEEDIPDCYKMFDYRHEFHDEKEVHEEK